MAHKRMKAWAWGLGLGIGCLALTLGSDFNTAQAAPPASKTKVRPVPVPQAFRAVRAGVSPRVADLPTRRVDVSAIKEREGHNPPDKEWQEGASAARRIQTSPDGALSDAPVPNAMPPVTTTFEGLSQATQGAASGFFVSPPDTVGDVGPNHYVQCVNLACQVFTKAGVGGAVFTLDSLFTALGGDCATLNDGDPIVLYDPLADRWQLSQFAVGNRPPSHQCIAVSQTGDPNGAYWVYDFAIPGGYFNDYPKLSVWSDGYYMTAPLFEGPFFGQGVFAFNRSKMLSGDPSAEMIFFDLTTSYPGLERVLPADIDGQAPPAGTPQYMISIAADEFGSDADAIRFFEFKPDFNNPALSTWTEKPSLPVASFDPTFTEVSGNCGPGTFDTRDDIDQPAPANCRMRLESLSNRPMHRLAYRRFGSREAMVFTHSVDVNATPATSTTGARSGIRYYELSRSLPGGAWTVADQATHAPADTVNRWMGSAALDAQGNLGVAFSISDSASTFPGISYAGRLFNQSGGLLEGEANAALGTRAQTSTGSRWGDYAAMSVDPADECTFWFTTEYYGTPAPPSCSATTCWQTRIFTFKFPGCTTPTSTNGTLGGTVTDSAAAPVAGALVEINGYTGVTNGSGVYSISLPAGTYAATASKAGYVNASATGVVITTGGNTTRDFTLNSGSVAGVVTDAVSTNPIAGATVAVASVVKLSNGTGNYSIPLAPGSYTVNASATGYFPASQPATVAASGATTANFALNPAPVLKIVGLNVDDSSGNGSGGIDPDECVGLDVTLQNDGTVNATGVSATLTTTSPGVTVSTGGSSYPNIASGGGTGTNVVRFRITSSPSLAALGQPIALKLTLTVAGGTLDVPFNLATGGSTSSLNVPFTGPVAIPDNNAVGAAAVIPVSGFTGTLSKVRVRTRITHTFDGDLVLRLRGPDNTVVTLAYQAGGAGAGFGTDCPADGNDTTFDDGALVSILDAAATPPYVGSFRPQLPLTAFAGKSGAQVNGNWRFEVVDLGPADIGNIECVQLELNGTLFGGGGCYTKGDMNHPNRQTDLIFRHTSANLNMVWLMDGITRTASALVTPDPPSSAWQVVGADDFNGDLKTDLVFWNNVTGAIEFWLMNGTDRSGAPVPLTGASPLSTNWKLSATGDFNRDGKPDLLWRNDTSQALVIWKMGEGGAPGTQKTGNIIPSPSLAIDANWIVVGALDLNRDGNRDILWYNFDSGKIVYWYMDGNVQRITGNFTNPANAGDNNWKVLAEGDYGSTPTNPTRDGQPDIVWRNSTSGNIVVWFMDSAGNRTNGAFTNPTAPGLVGGGSALRPVPDAPLDWVIVGPR